MSWVVHHCVMFLDAKQTSCKHSTGKEQAYRQKPAAYRPDFLRRSSKLRDFWRWHSVGIQMKSSSSLQEYGDRCKKVHTRLPWKGRSERAQEGRVRMNERFNMKESKEWQWLSGEREEEDKGG